MRAPKIPPVPYPTSTAQVIPSLFDSLRVPTDPSILTTPKQRRRVSRAPQLTLIGGDVQQNV